MAAKHVPDTGRVEFVELDIGLEGVAEGPETVLDELVERACPTH